MHCSQWILSAGKGCAFAFSCILVAVMLLSVMSDAGNWSGITNCVRSIEMGFSISGSGMLIFPDIVFPSRLKLRESPTCLAETAT